MECVFICFKRIWDIIGIGLENFLDILGIESYTVYLQHRYTILNVQKSLKGSSMLHIKCSLIN